jgi:hypothetical protein
MKCVCLGCEKVFERENLIHPDNPDNVITCKCGSKAFKVVP